MPTIAWVNGIPIRMYLNDHAPPHFHAYSEGGEARIDIVTGEVIGGRLKPTARRLLKEWTLENHAALMRNWELARAQQPLEHIPSEADD